MMSSDEMTPKQLEEMHVRVGRKLQQPETFGEVADAGIDEQEFGDPKTRRAERNIGKLLAEQQEDLVSVEPGGVDDDYLAELGLESTGDEVLDLALGIEELQGLIGESSGDPEKVDSLTWQLGELQQRKAVVAVTALMQKQRQDREDEAEDRDLEMDDL